MKQDIEIIELKSPQDRLQYLEKFDPDKTTWIVSDSASKEQIEKFLLKKKSYLKDYSVLKVSEFWDELIKRSNLEWKFYPKKFIESYLSYELSLRQKDIPEGILESVVYYIEKFSYVLKSKKEEVIDEWLKNENQSSIRWKTDWEHAKKAWILLMKNKMMIEDVKASFLIDEDLKWEKDLMIDLGFEIEFFESQIISQISQKSKVTVLRPLQTPLYSYLDLNKRNIEKNLSFSLNTSIQKDSQLIRAGSQLDEVKIAVQKIKNWIKEEKSLEKIVISAAQIDEYKNSLIYYLKKENIPVKLSNYKKYQQDFKIQKILSRLRILSKKISFSDLENIKDLEKEKLSYNQFKDEFWEINSQEQLSEKDKKEFSLKKTLYLFKDFNEVLFEQIQQEFKEKSPENLIHLICSWYKSYENVKELKLSFSSWLTVFENFCNKIISSETNNEGIRIEKIENLKNLELEYICILGCHNHSLRQEEDLKLSLTDIIKIHNDLGINLPVKNSLQKEMELEWIFLKKCKEIILTSSNESFSSKALSPHYIWFKQALKKGRDLEQINPIPRSFDKISFLEKKAENLYQKEMRKEIKKNQLNYNFKEEIKSLSVSQLSNYTKCPFVFYSNKILKLEAHQMVSAQTNALSSGSFYHELLENFIGNENWDLSYLNDYIESLKNEFQKNRTHFYEQSWSLEKNKIIKTIQKIKKIEDILEELSYERAFKKELAIEVDYCFSKKDFVKKGEGDLPFRGKIDRIDRMNQDHYILYDYKRSSSDKTGKIDTQIKNNYLQLPFYAYLIEKNLIEELEPLSLKAGLFYTLKESRIEGGFCHLDDLRKKLNIKRIYRKNELDSQWEIFLQKIDEQIENIKKGEFSPLSKKSSECEYCDRKVLCRASHL